MTDHHSQAWVFQINLSKNGMPKLPVRAAGVTHEGLAGDGHSRKDHGGSERAVCLYSLERILEMQREGHSIYPGSTGENFTLYGLDWSLLVPGVRLKLGEVLLEISEFDQAACPRIEDNFSDGDVRRMVQAYHPGWARVYARVLKEGFVMTGDQVEIHL